MAEPTNTPMNGMPDTNISRPPAPAFYITGSFSKDLTMAALGSMAGVLVSYLLLIVDLGFVGAILVYASRVLLYWGLLQIGRLYQLRWLRRGATLLILSRLIGLLPFVITAFSASFATWLTGILEAIGIVIAFVDLWAIRSVWQRNLVTIVVLGFIAGKFVTAMELFTYPQLQLFRAINVGLLAWLFYELIAQNRLSPVSQPNAVNTTIP